MTVAGVDVRMTIGLDLYSGTRRLLDLGLQLTSRAGRDMITVLYCVGSSRDIYRASVLDRG